MPRRNRPTVVHPLAVRELRVLRVADVTPGLRRVTLTGDQLGAFTPTEGVDLPAFVSTGFDDDVRLLLPYPGETVPVLPVYRDGRLVQPDDRRALGRYYTVRRHDPHTRELDIDFVRHGVGVATTWASRARPGDVLHLGGPSTSRGLPEGFDWMLVAGDDTAAPAIARLLEELPEGARAQVFIEVAEPSHRQPLPDRPGVSVTWLSRAGAGAEGSVLLDAVRAAPWWDGDVYAWVAGEQAVVRDTRRHLVEDRGVPKARIDFVGYWKRSEAVALPGDPALPDPEQEDRAEETFHRLSGLLPPLAIRLAVQLDLGDLISRGVSTPAQLAERTGTVEWALRKFLRYLETIDLLACDGDGYRLTGAGQELTEDYLKELLDPRGTTARLERGFFGLAESLVTGRASYASVTGQDYPSLRQEPEFERAFLDEQADGAEFTVAPVVTSGALAGVRHLLVHSDVAGAVAAAVTEAHPQLRVTLVASSPAQADWLRDDLPRSVPDPARRERVDVAGPSVEPSAADAVLLVHQLARHPDVAAAELLRGLGTRLATPGRVLVFEEVLDPDDVDDDDAGADLLNLTVHGSGYRTASEVESVLAAAGLVVVARESLGWGDVLWTLEPQPHREGHPRPR